MVHKPVPCNRLKIVKVRERLFSNSMLTSNVLSEYSLRLAPTWYDNVKFMHYVAWLLSALIMMRIH